MRVQHIIYRAAVVLLYTISVMAGLFVGMALLFPLPDNISYSTIVTDNKGQVIHAFLTPDDKWRMQIEAGEISPLLRKTLLAKEDKYFYYHPGVNLAAIGRAIVNNVVSQRRTSGASTITMQVARALEPKRRTYWNKGIEVFRAFQLECKYSKAEIFAMYLDLIPYGGNIEGVKAASNLYFRKAPDHLSLAEITTLAVIPNRPSSFVIGKSNDLIIRARNRWLTRFAADGLFTRKEIRDALGEPLTATRNTVPKLVPHLSQQLRYSGSSAIHTTIDLNMQQKAEKLLGDYIHGLHHKNIRNAAAVIIENETGQIVTYIGSANFADTTDAGQVNGAAAVRQPGSTLKPLLYGLCIDEGLMTPKMMLTDVAVSYDGYAPENYDNRFHGNVSMEYALEHSLNIPAVKSLKKVGKELLIQKLVSCDFRQVRKDRYKLGLSMILGGCGATLEELTGLYSCFSRDGVYIRPSFLRHDSLKRKTRIISPAATFMINETLSKINRPDFPLNWQATGRLPKIAWKTGTSYGRRDAWSIGYNRKYTVGIWVGNFSGQGIPELSGSDIATPLLFKIFNSIDYDSDEAWFSQPAGCDVRIVCSETGLPPDVFCTNKVLDYFIPLVSTTVTCNNMQEVAVSPDGQMSYCRSCLPENGYQKKWYKMIPTDLQLYYDENNVAYTRIPAHNGHCERVFRDGAPTINFPVRNTEYLISRNNPEPLELSCSAAGDVSKVYWHINNKFYKASPAKSKLFFLPEEGPVKISCTDDKGRNQDVWITVKFVNL